MAHQSGTKYEEKLHIRKSRSYRPPKLGATASACHVFGMYGQICSALQLLGRWADQSQNCACNYYGNPETVGGPWLAIKRSGVTPVPFLLDWHASEPKAGKNLNYPFPMKK